jgi:hypothetical protein
MSPKRLIERFYHEVWNRAAEFAAVREFNLTAEQRKRLVVHERI